MMPEMFEPKKVDRFVQRLRTRTIGSYKPPKVTYTCRLCPLGRHSFSTTSLTEAWAHTMMHGPWDVEASGGATYVLNLSAQAQRNGVAHPRGERLS